MSVRARIFRNLKDRVYGVNTLVAISGTDSDEGFEELSRMIKEGLVEEKRLNHLPLYTLSFAGREMRNDTFKVVGNETGDTYKVLDIETEV